MSGIKTYKVHWEATLRGIKTVKAFDEDDAEEQVEGERLDMEDCESAHPTFKEVMIVEESDK